MNRIRHANGQYKPVPITERFWTKVNRQEDGCWEWLAQKDIGGYGVFWVGKPYKAHRFAYELMVGPIPENLQIDHLCRNRACVNPIHLEPVPGKTNIQRGLTGNNNKCKMHCPSGHSYNQENTYIDNEGGRRCRTCKKIADRRWRERKHA